MGDRDARGRLPRHVGIIVAAAVAFTIGAAGVLPASSDDRMVTFSAAGDYGMNVNGDAVLRAMHDSGNDLNLALGDMLGAGGVVGTEGTFCDYVTARVGAGYPFELIAGNHDNGSNGNINDFSACLPNQLPGLIGTYGRQYFVDYPAADPLVRFVMVSPNMAFNGAPGWNYTVGSTRYQWTAAAIDGARAAGIPWVVAGMHYQCLSVGMYDCPMTPDLANLFVSKKVDLVLTGHEHLYQRTKQLSHGSGCAALAIAAYNASCVIDADNAMTKGAGTVFLSVGLGGVQNRAVNLADPEAEYFAALSGMNLNSSYGFLSTSLSETTLSAQFVNAVGPFTDSFSISSNGQPPPNVAPTARLGVACTGLTCTADGTTSTDPDGQVASYAWTFGDGATATGPTAPHTYAAGGTYTVGLTIADDDGAPATASQVITVIDPAAQTVYAADTFTRTSPSSWGTADVGGSWAANTALSTTGTAGVISMAAGAAPSTTLAAVSAQDVDVRATVTIDRLPQGGSGTTVSAFARRVGSARYWVKVRVAPTGAVYATLSRLSSTGAETAIAAESLVPGLTAVAGTPVNVRLQVTGASPTTVRAKIWTGGTEPTAWLRTATDSTAGLQGPGAVGFQAYTSGSTTNAPIKWSIDDYRVVAPAP